MALNKQSLASIFKSPEWKRVYRKVATGIGLELDGTRKNSEGNVYRILSRHTFERHSFRLYALEMKDGSWSVISAAEVNKGIYNPLVSDLTMFEAFVMMFALADKISYN